jgi:hypothetical protein
MGAAAAVRFVNPSYGTEPKLRYLVDLSRLPQEMCGG